MIVLYPNGNRVQVDRPRGGSRVLLTRLQKLVGGIIAAIPHSNPDTSETIAYVHDEGVIQGLKVNVDGAKVLEALGYDLSPDVPVCGPVVLMGTDDKALTKAQIARIFLL